MNSEPAASDQPLTGRTVLVLGATGSVGTLVTGHLLLRGAQVVASSRTTTRIDGLRTNLARNRIDTTRLRVVQGDLASLESAQQLLAAVQAAIPAAGPHGQLPRKTHTRPLHGVVAALGGWPPPQEVLSASLEQWEQVIRSNLTTHFVAARTFVPHLLGQGSGVYVPISGPAGEIVRKGTGIVSTAVAAQRMLDQALQVETHASDVTIEELIFSGSGLRPGWVDPAQLIERITELLRSLPSAESGS